MDDLTEELIRAAREGDAQGVEAALKGGANIDFLGKGGWSALHHAAFEGNVDMTRLLISFNADVGVSSGKKSEAGVTPLHLAAEAGYDLVMEALLEAGADITATDSNGFQPVHWATTQVTALAVLLNHDCNLSAQARDLSTPLHHAATEGKLDVVKWLVQNGADSTIKDKDGRLPVDRAKKKKHRDVADYLKRAKPRGKSSSVFGTMRKSFRKQKHTKEDRRSSEPNLSRKSASQPNLLSTSSKAKSAEEPHEKLVSDSPDFVQTHHLEESIEHTQVQSRLEDELYQKDALIRQLQSEKEAIEQDLYRKNIALAQTQQMEDKVRDALIGVLGRLRNEEGDGREEQPMVLNLETQVNELEQHLERQRQELASYQDGARQYVEELEAMKNLHQGEMVSLSRQVEELQSQLEWERKERAREQVESQQRLEPMQFEVDNFRRTMVDLEDQVRELQQHLEGQQREHSKLQTLANQRIQSLQGENDEYKKTVTSLEGQVRELQGHLDGQQRDHSRDQTSSHQQLQSLEKQNEQYKQTVVELERKVEELQQDLGFQERDLSKELTLAKQRVQSLEIQNTNYRTMVGRLEERVKHLEEHQERLHAAAKDKETTLTDQLSDVRKENDEKRSIISDLEQEINQLKFKINIQEEKNKKKLHETRLETNKTDDAKNHEIAALRKEKEELEKVIRVGQGAKEELQNKLQELQEKCKSNEREMQAVQREKQELLLKLQKNEESIQKMEDRLLLLTKQRETLLREREEVTRQLEEAKKDKEEVAKEKEKVIKERDEVTKQREELMSERERLSLKSDVSQTKEASDEESNLKKQNEDLRGKLKVVSEFFQNKQTRLREKCEEREEEVRKLEKEIDELRNAQNSSNDTQKDAAAMVSQLRDEVQHLNEHLSLCHKELEEAKANLQERETAYKKEEKIKSVMISKLEEENEELVLKLKENEKAISFQELREKVTELKAMENQLKDNVSTMSTLQRKNVQLTKIIKTLEEEQQAKENEYLQREQTHQEQITDLEHRIKNLDQNLAECKATVDKYEKEERYKEQAPSQASQHTIASLQVIVQDLSNKLRIADENLLQKQQDAEHQQRLNEERERNVISLQCSVEDLAAKLQEAETKCKEKADSLEEVKRKNNAITEELKSLQGRCEQLTRELHSKQKQQDAEHQQRLNEERERNVISLQCSVKDLAAKLQEAETKFRNCMLEKMETVNEVDRVNKNKAAEILAMQNKCEELTKELAQAKNKLQEKEKKHKSQEEAKERVIARLREETMVLLKKMGEQESAIRQQAPVHVEEYREEVEEGMWRESESEDYVGELLTSPRGRQGISVSTSTCVRSRGVVSTSQITRTTLNPRRRSPSPSNHHRGEEQRHRSRSATPPRTPPCERLTQTNFHRGRSSSTSGSSSSRQQSEEHTRRPSRSMSVPRHKVDTPFGPPSNSYITSVAQCLYSVGALRSFFCTGAYRCDLNTLSKQKGETAIVLAEFFNAMGSEQSVASAAEKLRAVTKRTEVQSRQAGSESPIEFLSCLVNCLLDDLTPSSFTEAPPRSPAEAFSLFVGQKDTKVYCGKRSVTLSSNVTESFRDLTLTVTATRAWLLEELFQQHFRTQSIEWHCRHCEIRHSCIYETTAVNLPRVLLLNLNRVYHGGVDKTRVVFPPVLQLRGNSPYMTTAKGGAEACYSLRGVCSRKDPMDPTLPSSSFAAACRRSNGRGWFIYSEVDGRGRPTTIEKVLEEERDAVVLVYEEVSGDWGSGE
ncbi:trichohyalin-like isoform X2 [Penaeus monodon]|uniref:trichohyalin-like isoform X2 n=1 Tax=Penaeus monodon TaxID=6687 RepID=UPI0018A79951|nr:trichohyalin-like isoform X2 [Penaeus monodon]